MSLLRSDGYRYWTSPKTTTIMCWVDSCTFNTSRHWPFTSHMQLFELYQSYYWPTDCSWKDLNWELFRATNAVIVQSFSIIRAFICNPSVLLLTLLYLNLEAKSWIGNAFPTIPSASSIYFSPILKRKHTHLTYVSQNTQSNRRISWHSFSQNVAIIKSSSLPQQHTKQ